MPSVKANGITIEYEEFGRPNARPMLLIMGLGAQMILWDEEFCEMLADRNHRVIRFDNRDVGKSTWFDHLGVPDVLSAVTGAMMGAPVTGPYTLSDMAADTVGLLDALGIERAHVVGASMGGMIAQTLAIEYPRRVASLTSIMSSTGNPDVSQPRPEALAALLGPLPTNRDEAVDSIVRFFRVVGSPGFPFDEQRVRDGAALAFDRGFNPLGVARQLVASLASGSRTAALRSVRVPALVIHGKNDPLIPLAGGEDTAAALPRAELLVIDGMGHDLPPAVWRPIVDAICALTARAKEAA